MMSNKGLYGLGVFLAIGLIIGALLFSFSAYKISNNKQSITVKGVAEQPVSSTNASWNISVFGMGNTPAEAFEQLRQTRKTLLKFLKDEKFTDQQIKQDIESYAPVYEQDAEGRTTNVIQYYQAEQLVTVTSQHVNQVDGAVRHMVKLYEKGLPVKASRPAYLVGNLDDVKVALIAEATKNANRRAVEFANTGNARIGSIKSASQGTFNILSAQGNQENDGSDYGGVYDTSSIDKIIRVVVTVEYGLSQ